MFASLQMQNGSYPVILIYYTEAPVVACPDCEIIPTKKERFSMYPIIELVENAMRERKLNRKRVCHALGYSEAGTAKAFRSFDKLMAEGIANGDVFLQRLADVLRLDRNAVAESCARSRAIRIAEERMAMEIHARRMFTPHLWAQPTSRQTPSPLFVILFCGENGFRRANLPAGIERMSLEQQKQIVRQAAQRHYSQKKFSPFGEVLGYRFRLKYESYWVVSVQGEFQNFVEHDPPQITIGSIRIGHKEIVTSPDGLIATLQR
jgi:hypothetical protein